MNFVKTTKRNPKTLDQSVFCVCVCVCFGGEVFSTFTDAVDLILYVGYTEIGKTLLKKNIGEEEFI